MGIVEFRALGGESEQQLSGGDGTLADNVPVNRRAHAESTAHRFRHVEHSGKSKETDFPGIDRFRVAEEIPPGLVGTLVGAVAEVRELIT